MHDVELTAEGGGDPAEASPAAPLVIRQMRDLVANFKAGRKTLVLKATTFVNASGQSVGEAARSLTRPGPLIVGLHC